MWYLTDLSEARGRQHLFTRQSPQILKILREHAVVESAVSSNRIEGVTVERSRIGTIVFGKPSLRDREEEEVRGYRDALNWIHEKGARLPISVETILKLHQMCRGAVWDAGSYKEKDVDIIQSYPDGRSRVRFKTVPPEQAPRYLAESLELWQQGLKEKWIHPLVLACALNFDFLCIHPFRDGNGRVSRLLFLLSLYHCGYEVGRYISLERIVEDNKERYYEVLEQSSQQWHEGNHDPWPVLNFLLFILIEACREFEQRVGQMTSARGAKTEQVCRAIESAGKEFTVTDIERHCPGVSRDMVRRVLGERKAAGLIECVGRGPGAKWAKKR